ncbi:MAG: tetratricopeptide repeat protein, partial [Persicimonas sp.]
MTEKIHELQQALDSDPSDREAFERLADRYAEAGDWRRLRWHFEEYADNLEKEEAFSQLAFVLGELARAEEDPSEKAAILVALGDVLFEHLQSHEEGMDAYQRAFKANPNETTSLERARRVYRRQGRFEQLIVLYDLQRDVCEDSEELARLSVKVAQVHGDYLGDREAALDELEGAVDEAPQDALAATIASIYESGGTVEAAVEDKERGAHEAAARGDEAMAASLLLEAARLERAREGGSLERASELAERAEEFDDDNGEVASFAATVRASLDERSEPITLDIVDAVDRDDEPGAQADGEPETLEFGAKAVESVAPTDDGQKEAEPEGLDEDSLAADGGGGETLDGLSAISTVEGDLDDALAVLEDDPGDMEALAIVRKRLREEGAYEELAEQLEASVKYLRKQEGELEVMVDLAKLYWQELGDLDRAEYFFKRVKLLDGQQPDMLAFYDDYYRREGQWRKLYALLSGQQSEVDELKEALELSARLARIAEVQMESPDKAIDVWKTFLRRWGPEPSARQELRRLYEENEKWNALVDFLKERERELAASDEETTAARVMLLERMAEIYRGELGLDAMVINTLQSILELEPDHQVAFSQLEERLREGRRWNELAELLGERAEVEHEEGNDEQAIAYLLEVADLWKEELRNVTQALPYLERAVEIDPGRQAIKDELREIYEKRRDYESLFDLDVTEARALPEAEREERLEELLALAEEKLRDPQRLAHVLEELLEIRTGDEELLDRLESIHRESEDFENLAALLEHRAELTDDAERRRGWLVEAATLRQEELEQFDEAAELWRRLLDEGAEEERAVEALTAIYFREDRLDELQDLYGGRGALDELHEHLVARADASEERERARTLRRRAAVIARDELGEPGLAARDLEVV